MARPRTCEVEYEAAQVLADTMAQQLRGAARAVGLSESESAQIRGRVSSSGTPYVDFGAFRIGSAMRLLAALTNGGESSRRGGGK
ncbi:hypothetical protein HUT18_15780 [Streptomyces sp. NA04227]|uniref:hypothetical protein n=1 Tax=Streptomyces sp. NA04227 TaxID=2742136 RepID=UPI001590B95B|nr:hypothetical protein [Streptomyces sp. NA04227]QKW07621.1 hypothetical protein HUT18_15780 [Streptomyces sp. NA04227]